MQIKFTVFGIPVAKGRPKFTKRGFAYTPKKTVNAENDFKMQALKFKPSVPWEGAISLTARFFMPIPASMPKKFRISAEGEIMPHTKRPDADNLLKLISDAMNGIFFKDDNQISDLQIEKRYSAKPRIEVLIEDLI
jgi:Holliday junction resolvase RusA-like endonuclease